MRAAGALYFIISYCLYVSPVATSTIVGAAGRAALGTLVRTTMRAGPFLPISADLRHDEPKMMFGGSAAQHRRQPASISILRFRAAVICRQAQPTNMRASYSARASARHWVISLQARRTCRRQDGRMVGRLVRRSAALSASLARAIHMVGRRPTDRSRAHIISWPRAP